MSTPQPQRLTILWTNPDPVTAKEMVLLYAMNAKTRAWWDEVTVVVWGAPALMIAENKEVREAVEQNIAAGVRFSACKKCADDLGVTDILTGLGIETKYWGEPLTELLRSGAKLLSI